MLYCLNLQNTNKCSNNVLGKLNLRQQLHKKSTLINRILEVESEFQILRGQTMENLDIFSS